MRSSSLPSTRAGSLGWPTCLRLAHATGLYTIINVHQDGADDFKEAEWIALNDAQRNSTATQATHASRSLRDRVEANRAEPSFESNEIRDDYAAPGRERQRAAPSSDALGETRVAAAKCVAGPRASGASAWRASAARSRRRARQAVRRGMRRGQP